MDELKGYGIDADKKKCMARIVDENNILLKVQLR